MSQWVIPVEEYQPRAIQGELPEELLRVVDSKYRSEIALSKSLFSPALEISSNGYVGFIPLSPEVGLHLKPKVSIGNLFRMLEVAYRVHFAVEDGDYQSDSLLDFYSRLARILSKRILDRGRKGFYRSYEPAADTLPYIRERVDTRAMLRAPWKASFNCDYHEHTADIEDNQILLWTIERVLRSNLCAPNTTGYVRQAFLELSRHATSLPFLARDCVSRRYNRLNEDYSELHSLCRFFLEHTGPGHQIGDHRMIPFLINMNRLSESYVAVWLGDWLRKNAEGKWLLKQQESVSVSKEHGISYKIDLVLVDAATGKVRCVMDTKYKKPEKPSDSDINQVIAYAETQQCADAFLIYPTNQVQEIDIPYPTKRVRTLVFDIGKNLESAGEMFAIKLLSCLADQ